MTTTTRLLTGALLAAGLSLFTGCERSTAAPAGATPPPPEIPVVRVTPQTAPDALPFTGRLDALHRIEIRPRVSGHVASIRFREGDLVQPGDVLFEIDPRPYQARRDLAAAELARATAALALAHQERSRAAVLRRAEAISAEEFERRQAEAAVAEAGRRAAAAALAAAELEVEFTAVRAPVGGRVGRALITPGNLARAGDDTLAHLVSVEPMRVRFAVDEPIFQRLLALPPRQPVDVRVHVPGVATPLSAVLDYLGTAVDPATGTADVRATLAPAGAPLVDGMYARVDLLLPADPGRVLVPETALGAEQGSRYVLVTDAQNRLVHRRVTLGPRFGPERAVTGGLTAGEHVVAAGLQFLRPGMSIRPLQPAPAATPAASGQ